MAIDKKIKYEMQGNEKPARNYLGKQKTVTVPVKWKSNPKAPKTELAYITKAEKDLLIKKDLHGSLKKGANTGPSGIMSLDSQGDYTRDRSSNNAANSSDRATSERGKRAESNMQNILTGNVSTGQTSAVSDRTRRGAMPEVAYGPDGRAKMMYAQKAAGNPQGFLGRLFSGNNQYGYRDTYNKTGGFMGFGAQNDVRFNPVTQRYEFEEEETGDVKPGRGGQILGGLASIATGIPFVGSAIGSAIDRFKPKSYMEKQTPEEISRMKSLQMINGELVDTRMLDFDPNAQIQKPTNVPMDSLGPYNKPIETQTSYTGGSIPFNPGMTTMYGNGITETEPFGNPNKFTSDLSPEFQDMAVNIGLTEKQKSLLDQRKGMLDVLGPEAMLNNIQSEDDPNDPATLNDVKKYYGLPV